ncbi:MAG: hypothetical protein ABII08_02780 [Candidatus Beckwithbacteria bacterium]|nr:hypothetical protein [Patescibacteria group bacterium]
MKKFTISLFLFLLIASPTLAQEQKQSQIMPGALEGQTERIQERVQTLTQKRTKFQERLQLIKDEKKQKITERIDTQLNKLNTKVTTTLTKILGRLSIIVDKLADKTDTAEASEAISLAQAAVDKQATEEYVIEFSDENGLKVGASAAKESLRSDLVSVRELVKSARQAVKDALDTAKLVNN